MASAVTEMDPGKLSKGSALVLMVAASVLLGTWPNAFKRNGQKYSTPTEYQYLVYAPSCMLATTVFVFAMVGEELEDELADLGGSKPRVVMAFLAGFVIASGNMLYVYAANRIGMTLALFIQASGAILIGSMINYILEPDKSDAALLFIGVAFSFVAVCACTYMNWTRSKAIKEQALSARSRAAVSVGEKPTKTPDLGVSSEDATAIRSKSYRAATGGVGGGGTTAASDGDKPASPRPDVATVDETNDPEAAQVQPERDEMKNGFAFIIACAVCTAAFSPLYSLSVKKLGESGPEIEGYPLSAYAGIFFWAFGFATAGIVNSIAVIVATDELSLAAAMSQSKDVYIYSAAAGVITAAANCCIFIGGSAAGFAASLAISMSNPLVGSLYGIFLWKEFERMPRRLWEAFSAMTVLYIASVAFVFLSVE